MMHKTVTITVSILLAAYWPASAQLDGFGSPPATDDLVRAELLVEANTVMPDEPFWVAIRLKMKDDWHVNWINPGDAGLAPTVEWTIPDGWKVSDLLWPYPTRFDITELSIFGYEKEVLLLASVTPPSSLEGDKTTLAARVDWLACAEACVPGQSVASLTLSNNVNLNAERGGETDITRARRALPVVDERWRFSASVDTEFLTLGAVERNGEGTKLENVAFFPLESGIIDNASKQVLKSDNGSYELRIVRDRMNQTKPTRIRGVLVSESGWGGDHKAVAVDVPLQ